MGLITVNIDDGLDEKMRAYIAKTWSRPHGRITQVVEEALLMFLKEKADE
jgi:hypothetical protein